VGLLQRRRKLGDFISWIVISGSLVLLVLALGGCFRNNGPSSAAVLTPPTLATTPRSPSVAPAVSARRKPPPRVTRVAITASRGDCWLSARAGSAGGRILFEGLVRHGRSVGVASRVVWIRFGASQNVSVRVNGRPTRVPHGTVDLTLGRGRAA
jgi:hypothetical protein